MKKFYLLGLVVTTISLTLMTPKISDNANFSDLVILPTNSHKLLLAQNERPKIQIAILLDSSNSMDGLIEQTRTKIWNIVNAISHVTKKGKTPILEVSLYHYGNDSLPSAEGFNRLLNEFTPELDVVSEKLFSIKTNGGQEYTGWVIDSAMKQLKWSNNKEDFRVIFIAGNESFDQGSIPWKKSIDLAVTKDILVNTIYCGNSEDQDSSLWANGASEGKGSYFNINQNEKIASIPTPYDTQITELNNQLNQTYIPYGSQGTIGQQRQVAEDTNAFNDVSSGAALSRSVTKTSGYYRNSSWDLVDAVTDNVVNLASLDNSILPENMRSMSLPQKREYIETVKNKRNNIKAKIAELSKKRDEYITKKTPTLNKKDSLDYVMIEALRKQLEAKGFTLK